MADDRTYFVFTVEGEMPADITKEEGREALNGMLPDWADGYFTRFDGGDN